MWAFSKNKNWAYLEERFDWVMRMRDVEQDVRYHAEGNVAIHTQMVLAALVRESAFMELSEQDQEILWASALLHDVEKYSTTVVEAMAALLQMAMPVKEHSLQGNYCM